jgi:hypothetical protein
LFCIAFLAIRQNGCKHANRGLDTASNPKCLKSHLFDGALELVGTEVRVPQRRGIRFVPGKLLDVEQRHSFSDQA